ncbi:histidine kinase [Kitasatospora sp. NBC_01250]|uniref:sensor histidine kinase n=1 Tax=unclassified Kitasatospora TaxID=2633591 RepID=UPI002E0F6D47|nr:MULTISPECIES: histidine kinase [unclassified Kitasatospora]WSJ67286.1 histidine kinase [Kitasatospora sp. NBC_01302]
MPLDTWTRWPSREALSREKRSLPGLMLSGVGRLAMLTGLVLGTFNGDRLAGGAGTVAGAAVLLVAAVALLQLFYRTTRRHRIRWSLAVAGQLLVLAPLAHHIGADTLADVIWCVLAVVALQRLPLAAALPTCAAALASFAVTGGNTFLALLATVAGLLLLGYLLRLDAEARGTAQRLLQQEQAARAAEAESAALAERARIAREIHDVLAHSLSAQLVHLEAARLMLDGGADREQIRERVVAARRMAQDGLKETKQALSALRGEFTPVGEFLVELAQQEQARLTVTGTPRPLNAEVGLAVRRTAQEALTNIRKHAPRAHRTVELQYLDQEVELLVRNDGGPAGGGLSELAASGNGYGLLGMRERAELIGGSLQAGPEADGWLVRLRLPA